MQVIDVMYWSKLRKMKRGLYGAVVAGQKGKTE
jgi:hypothetical protein